MRIPDSKIAEIAAASDIVDVISDYVDLKKAGKDYRGLCPFHGDKDPSFYVSPHKEIFYCFGCQVGGSVFRFLMKIENISFIEAVQKLAERFGVPIKLDKFHSQREGKKHQLTESLKAALEYFQDQLRQESSCVAYLEDRGVPKDWAERLSLGFAPDSWNGLCQHLHNVKTDLSSAAAAGLVRAKSGGGYYDYFRSRVMIPIRSLGGDLVAFGGRIIGEGEPKYLNSPESAIFRKRDILFGLESARHAVRSEGCLLIVEGYFDQISLRIRGMENVVAPLGTALGREQIRLAKRFTDRVITVFDADEAGIRALKRSIPLFLSEGVEPFCLVLTDHKDPDEAVRKVGIDGFRRMLDNAVPMIDFFLDGIEEQYDLKTLQGKNLAVEESLPILREIADSKEGDYLIERFRSRIGMREDRLVRLIRSGRARKRNADSRPNLTRKSLFDLPSDERNVVRGMLLRKGFVDEVIESGVIKFFQEPNLKELAKAMIDFYEQKGVLDASTFCLSLEDENLASAVARWMQPPPEEDDLRPEVEGDMVLRHSLDALRMRRFEARKAEIMERMKHCAPCEEEYNRLAEELIEIRRLKN